MERKSWVWLAVAGAVLLSCDDSTDPSDLAVTSVAVRLASDSLFYSQTARAIAVATGDSADAVQSRIEWSSSDTSIAVVTTGGEILGVGIGSATITASVGGKTDRLTVRVVLQRFDGGVKFKDGSYSYAGQCAISDDSAVYCRLLPPVTGTDSLFRRMPGGEGLAFTSIHTALDSQCGLVTSGQIFCWGRNGHFVFASRVPSEARTAPVAVKTDLRFSTMMTAGHSSICAVNRADDVLYCWGHNDSHQLGRAPSVSSDSNVAPVTGNLRARMVSGSNFPACALDLAGAAFCWGNTNFLGGASSLLGVDPTANGIAPAAVMGGMTFASISNGEGHRCALTSAGEAYCWGQNSAGQLGIGTTTTPSPNTPQRVSGSLRFSHISVSWASGTCGITTDDDLYCWGAFTPAVIHDRIGTRALEPYQIARGAKFIALSRGLENVCAITTEGHAVCW
jgi:hypothetical protein